MHWASFLVYCRFLAAYTDPTFYLFYWERGDLEIKKIKTDYH